MKIQVTSDDIKNGNRTFITCPVSLALNRETKKECIVDRHTIAIYDKYLNVASYCSPKSVFDFIRDFDDGLEVQPFEFDLGEE